MPDRGRPNTRGARFTQEVLFRGYIFRALRNWRGVWPAAVTTGVLFAATHLGWVSIALMVPIVVFGIAMCLLYHWTGSLYPCRVHAFGNAIPLAGALDWTWQAPLLVAGSTLAAWTLTRLLALGLGDGRSRCIRRLIHSTNVPEPARRREALSRLPFADGTGCVVVYASCLVLYRCRAAFPDLPRSRPMNAHE